MGPCYIIKCKKNKALHRLPGIRFQFNLTSITLFKVVQVDCELNIDQYVLMVTLLHSLNTIIKSILSLSYVLYFIKKFQSSTVEEDNTMLKTDVNMGTLMTLP